MQGNYAYLLFKYQKNNGTIKIRKSCNESEINYKGDILC